MSANSRDLTQGSIWSSIAKLALPMVIGIVAVFSVSLVDTFFVGKLGTQPLAALSFTFPVTMAIASLASGLGAGAASVVSRAIGSKDAKSAKRLSTDSLILASAIVVVISILGYLSITPLFTLLGAEGEVLGLVKRYMTIWYVSMPFLVIPIVANSIVRAAGNAFWPSVIMVAAAVINIGATPLLIFGFGPIPAFEIEGAAFGTMIARIVTFFFAFYIAIYREHLIDLTLPAFNELRTSWVQVLKIAIPAGTGSVINPIGIAVVTAIMATFGAQSVAAFGVATRIESFACIPMLALSAAIGPIVGQNWGAGHKDRVIEAVKKCFIVCFAWSVALALILHYYAPTITRLMASEQSVASESALYLTIVTASLWGYGIVIVASAAFNSLGRPATGLSHYLIRTAALYVPLSILASMWFNSEEVYYAIALSNGLAGLVVGSYTLWWLSRAEKCDCEPNVWANEVG